MKFLLVFTLIATCWAAEKKINMNDLPPAVRKTVEDLGKTSTIVGLAEEVEAGVTVYEAETKVNGKRRDVTIDASGKIVASEGEVALDSIPAPARASIEKEAAGGKITIVEKVTKGDNVKYEAAIQPNKGKKKEVSFNADGAPAKW